MNIIFVEAYSAGNQCISSTDTDTDVSPSDGSALWEKLTHKQLEAIDSTLSTIAMYAPVLKHQLTGIHSAG